MKKIAFVTLFPDWIRESLGHSIMARAEASGVVEFQVVNPRNFCYESHRKADDVPYGGHPGMLMKAEPVALAIESLLRQYEQASINVGLCTDQLDEPKSDPGGVTESSQGSCEATDAIINPLRAKRDTSSDGEVGGPNPQDYLRPLGEPGEAIERGEYKKPSIAIVITEPSGNRFEQEQAEELAQYDNIIFVCGHYEGIDHRIEETFATHVFSIGDYVLTNGELPALVMADAVVRLLPGVLGNQDSLEEESFQNNMLGAPNYTRPEVWREKPIPDVLKSGNHKQIDEWRREQAFEITKLRRPDLLDRKKP